MTGAALVEQMRRRRPDAVRLAEFVSLAVHIEPALLRAARLALRPVPPTATEADLWFSPLVEGGSPSGLVLRSDVAAALRRDLATNRARLERAHALVEEWHAGAPPTIRLEEELLWRTLTGDGDVEPLWKEVLATMQREPDRTDGIARWALRAMAAAPPGTLRSEPARMVAFAAGLHAPVPGGAAVVDHAEATDWLPWLRPAGTDATTVGLTLTDRGLRASRPPTGEAHHAVAVADGEPVILLAGVPDAAGGAVLELASPSTVDVDLSEVTVRWTNGTPRLTTAVDGHVTAMAASRPWLVVALDDGRVEAFTEDERVSLPVGPPIVAIGGEERFAGVDGTGRLWRLELRTGERVPTWSLPARVDPRHVVFGDGHLGAVVDGAARIWTFEGKPIALGAARAMAMYGEIVAILAPDGRLEVGFPDGPRSVWPERHREPHGIAVAHGGGTIAVWWDDSIQVHYESGLVKSIPLASPPVAVAVEGTDVLAVLRDGQVLGAEGLERLRAPLRACALHPWADLLALATGPSSVVVHDARGDGFLLEPVQEPETAPPQAPRTVSGGGPFPLGATWDGEGTNFSLFSENATRVELCLFGPGGVEERIEVREATAQNWHCYLPGVGPGQRYGYRVHGPYYPSSGDRFNPAKLLIDPYAKAIDGPVLWNAANVMPYVPVGGTDDDLELDDEDSAAAVPKSVVVDTYFSWDEDTPPDVPWEETVIYETHVKGFTMLHPDVPQDVRGTYAGFASEAAIAHLRSLGVTAVELLPIHHIADESFLVDRGLTNYWGASTIGYFAPHSGYAATRDPVREFKSMVKELHRAGIEVILDVVYNHTAEGNHLGPMLSFKGIDNRSYYRLVPDDPRFYMDFTGSGNTLNVQHPSVLRLIVDSLRYWVVECHVDGFRFDLASTLARGLYDVDRLSAFFDVIHQDPVLSQVKLIAEPWDVGAGGYQVGNFPVLWSEWNGMYRDVMRDFWRGHARASEFAQRFTGSADLYDSDGRHAFASINFITAHDGFTLRDLVSYNDKHNEANLEGNRDGTDDNRSWNCGVEGPTDDPEVLELRARQTRNLLATLLLSTGAPMLLGGDEFGRTQDGNNNAWCQDNEVSWYDWELEPAQQELFEFTRRLIELRRRHPVFRRSSFLTGERADASGLPDAAWFSPDGKPMTTRDWESGLPVVTLFLNGDAVDPSDEPSVADSFLLLANPFHEDVEVTLPPRRYGRAWALELDTADPEPDVTARPAGQRAPLRSRSMQLLRRLADDA